MFFLPEASDIVSDIANQRLVLFVDILQRLVIKRVIFLVSDTGTNKERKSEFSQRKSTFSLSLHLHSIERRLSRGNSRVRYRRSEVCIVCLHSPRFVTLLNVSNYPKLPYASNNRKQSSYFNE